MPRTTSIFGLLIETRVLSLGPLLTLVLGAVACSGSDNSSSGNAGGGPSIGGSASGGSSGTAKSNTTGGKSETGGTSATLTGGAKATGGQATTKASSATGGSQSQGGSATGGKTASTGSATGGLTAAGGTTSTLTASSSVGGNATTGGQAAGGNTGSQASGGKSNTSGGSSAANAGGTTTSGGSQTGGSSNTAQTGGTNATGGGSSCPFPTSFKWKDAGGPVAEPKNNWVALKDFTSLVSNGKHIMYMTMHDGSAYGSAMMTFTDWADAATAKQTKLSTNTVAPELIYFSPKKVWVLGYQWCSAKFCYATSSDATDASSWKFGNSMLTEDITSAQYGPIDQTMICDSTKCYLFYAADNGHIYRASMPIDEFPGTFKGSKSIISESSSIVFEAVEVYAVKGTGKYLMIIETNTTPRYFRAYSADSLDGDFTVIPGASSQSSPFAGKSNVTFTGTAWTDDISHGDLVRENPDETRTVDPCNMQLLYQGRNPKDNPSNYDLRAYRPGVLTKIN